MYMHKDIDGRQNMNRVEMTQGGKKMTGFCADGDES
jgi:hypothetical protein